MTNLAVCRKITTPASVLNTGFPVDVEGCKEEEEAEELRNAVFKPSN
jgi:hypothetical protein